MRNLPEVREIYDEVNSFHLGHRVLMVGFVDEITLERLYRNALALVFPSLYEGYGLPVLEAMTLGTPVLAAGTSSIPEILGDTGLQFDPRDQEGLVAALDRIFTDSSLRVDLARRAQDRSKLFSWNKAAEEILRIYESIQ
jgi:glycosyltransferase involved in cell wall biosynthesis